MSAMKGFAIRTYNGAAYTIDLTGAPYSGSKSIDITKTTSATSSQDGWNFIGNPFASPISWNATEANNPGATTGSYYVFNTTGEYTGNWGSFNGVTGTNGATNNIAIMQGFFCKKRRPAELCRGQQQFARSQCHSTFLQKLQRAAQRNPPQPARPNQQR